MIKLRRQRIAIFRGLCSIAVLGLVIRQIGQWKSATRRNNHEVNNLPGQNRKPFTWAPDKPKLILFNTTLWYTKRKWHGFEKADRFNNWHGITFHPDWMTKLPKDLINAPLKDIAIPGSHDSATYSLDIRNGFSPLLPKKVNTLLKLLKGIPNFEKFIARKVYQWSVTQTYNITEQLQLGIRYFDLRIFFKDNDKKLYTFHGLAGAPLQEILSQMVNFHKHHPKEILLLDFNHLSNKWNINTNSTVEPLNVVLKDTFKDKICHNRTARITLSQLWKHGKNVIIFYRGKNNKDSYKVPEFAWDDGQLDSPFNEERTYETKAWLGFLNDGYKHRPNNGKFYVTQGIMQPHWLDVVAASFISPPGTLESWTAEEATNSLVNWLHTCKRGSDGINIVMADFIHKHNFVEAVLGLNGFDFKETALSLQNASSKLSSSLCCVILVYFISICMML